MEGLGVRIIKYFGILTWNNHLFSSSDAWSGNGLGIRVVGGKEIPGSNGDIGAYIAKLTPGGHAEQSGKVVEGKTARELVCPIKTSSHFHLHRAVKAWLADWWSSVAIKTSSYITLCFFLKKDKCPHQHRIDSCCNRQFHIPFDAGSMELLNMAAKSAAAELQLAHAV